MPSTTIDEFGIVLFGTARAWRTRLDQRLRPLGLSQGHWPPLMNVARGGDKLTQKKIAERMGIEEPTLVGLLNRLETDGWIERRESPNDRRCKIVHLQRRSKSVLEKIFSTAHVLRNELVQDVPPDDLDVCIRVLTQIRQRAEQEEGSTRNGRRNVAKKD